MKKKKILIIGGTGVISYAVVNEALKNGFDVTCINRGRQKSQTLPPDVHLIIADYKKLDIIQRKLKGLYFDVVIDVLVFKEQDIEYSVSLFKDKCKQYIFFSSCAVYNKGNGDYECTEDSLLVNPVWPYSINKVKCEKKLIEIAKENNLTYTIVRPAVTYGNTRIPYGITPPYGYHGTIIQRILNNKPIILWDNGEAYSTITRVEDFAVGLVGLFGNSLAYNQEFHIVGDERHKWKNVITTMAKILKVKPSFFSLSKEQYAKEIPNRAGEILGGRGISQLLDNSKIKKVVPNFGTSIPLEEGLRLTINYYIENNYINGIDWKFDADTDRIVKKWCKKNKIDSSQYKLGFVDYLGNATVGDKIQYYLSYHKERYDIRLVRFIIKICRKFKRIYCKVIKCM